MVMQTTIAMALEKLARLRAELSASWREEDVNGEGLKVGGSVGDAVGAMIFSGRGGCCFV